MSRTADAYLQTRVSIFRANLLDDDGLRRLIDLSAEDGIGRLIPGVIDPERANGVADPTLVERALYDLLRLELSVLLRPLAGARATSCNSGRTASTS